MFAREVFMNCNWLWNGLTILLSFCINFGLVFISVDLTYSLWNFFGIFPQTRQLSDSYANGILAALSLPPYGMYREYVITATLLLIFGFLASFVFPKVPGLRHILHAVQGQEVPTPTEQALLAPALVILRDHHLPVDQYSFFVKHDSEINAFASGFQEITLHARLLQGFPAPELAGIIAHEMGHHRHGDVHCNNICNGFNFLTNLCLKLMNGFLFVLNLLRFIPFLGLVFVLFGWVLIILIMMYSYLIALPSRLFDLFFSRQVEFAADAYAAKAGLARELTQGLTRIQTAYGDIPWYRIPFVDHPRTKARIKKLEMYSHGIRS